MRRIAGLACALVIAGCGADEVEAPTAAAPAPKTELPPLPKDRSPRVVQPEAGVTASDDVYNDIATGAAEPEDAPKPTRAASSTGQKGNVPAAVDGSLEKATALPNGVALPPLEAPAEVQKVIEAGNAIARTPYKWGGGHGRFLDDGYDCSGSVSFALYAAGLIEGSRTSGGLLSWGEPGRGKWITVWTHDGHVFMEVAGIRFDTSGTRVTGSRWQNAMRSTSGFTPRHPPGL
jgi:cell wall-associated NlpC family hydrolase